MAAVTHKSPKRSPSRNKHIPAHVRHSLPGFTAENAYIILGHGNNGHGTFVVPPDCMIIVKSKKARTNPVPSVQNICTSLSTMEDVAMHPLEHIPDLISVLGSIRIYYPGDTCPNFRYSLCPFYDMKINKKKHVFAYGPGGVIPISRLKNNLIGSNDVDDFTAQQYIALYKDSVTPTKQEVSTFIQSIDPYEDASIVTLLYASPITTITQSELCTTPGIYYNVLCRETNGVDGELYNKEHQLSKKPEIKALQLEYIGNSLIRKAYLRNYYTSKKHKPIIYKKMAEYERLLQHISDTIDKSKIELKKAMVERDKKETTWLAAKKEVHAIEDDIRQLIKDRADLIRNGYL